MPIVIDRHTGEVISKPELSQEQKDAAWEQILRNWIRKNPEKFKDLLMENSEQDTI